MKEQMKDMLLNRSLNQMTISQRLEKRMYMDEVVV